MPGARRRKYQKKRREQREQNKPPSPPSDEKPEEEPTSDAPPPPAEEPESRINTLTSSEPRINTLATLHYDLYKNIVSRLSSIEDLNNTLRASPSLFSSAMSYSSLYFKLRLKSKAKQELKYFLRDPLNKADLVTDVAHVVDEVCSSMSFGKGIVFIVGEIRYCKNR